MIRTRPLTPETIVPDRRSPPHCGGSAGPTAVPWALPAARNGPDLRRALGVAVALLVLAGAGPASPPKKPATAPAVAKLTVAVLDFDAASAAQPDLGKQVGQTLTALLSAEDGFDLVDRPTLARTLQEHELSLTGLAQPEDAVKVGHLVGAKLLVVGRTFTLDRSLFVTAKLIGTETSLVDGVVVKGPIDGDLSELVAKLSAKLADRIRTDGPRLVAEPEAADPVPELRAKLAAAKVRLPAVAVSVSEQHYGPPAAATGRAPDPPVETELRAVLADVGLGVADADSGNLAGQNVDWVIRGEAFSEFAAKVGNLVSCSARAEIKVTDRRTGRLILSDRVTTRAADLSEHIAAKSALQKAGRELAVRLATRLADGSLSAATSGPTTAPAK